MQTNDHHTSSYMQLYENIEKCLSNHCKRFLLKDPFEPTVGFMEWNQSVSRDHFFWNKIDCSDEEFQENILAKGQHHS